MATDLARDKPTPANKYDAFVAAQLAKAESRIRLLDLTAGLLGLAALSLLYIVGMVLCDSKFMLSQQTRQLTLYAFLAGGGVYLFFAVLRPLRLRVNPYYAARQVELLLPHAKNSIVNWVDLHEQPLPPAIRGALGQRAAKDLSQVDLESAISGRRAAWMGALAGLFAIAFLVAFLLLGPAPFASLLKRTFNPFGAVGVSTRTQLTILKPEGGNATVTVGRGINFAVEVGGKTPNAKADDAVKLLYRYEEGDPWLERRLVPEDNREWTTSLSSLEIKNGFWYKITGGDAATDEYRVGVRAAPAILHFLATYHFRPYVARADEVSHERALKELRGTEILLRVHTNRMLREGWLEFEKEGAKPVRGEVDANDPHTLFVRFVLNEDGKYRLRFTSTENEAYNDPVAYPVTALPDNPPTVELTKPGKDIRLPADALLQLEGKADDDIGVASLVLRMRANGDKLRGQPYRSDERMRLTDGGYPLALDYRDFVELSRVQSEDGQAYPLRAGMELEYWLEARDACDYPQANVAESKHYRVLLTEAEKNEPKQQQEKKQAQKEKKQAEENQDRQMQKENRERRQQRQEQQARNQEEENKSKDDDKGKARDPSQAKEGAQPNNPEGKDNNGAQGENNNGQGENNNNGQGENNNNGQEENEGLSKEDRATEEQIEKALEKKEDAKGEGKPEKSDPGESKGDRNKADSDDASSSKSEGENKGADARAGKDSGEGKDKGQSPAGNDASKGDGKGKHPSDSPEGGKSEPKGGVPKNRPGAGESGEAKSKPDTAPQPSENKNGDPQANTNAGQGKPQPMGQGQDSSGDNKPADGKGQQGEREATDASKDKGNGQAEAKIEKDGRKDEGKAEGKQGGTSSTGEPVGEGDAKPSSGNGASDATGQGQGKPDATAQAREAAAKEIQELARKLESEDAGEREEAKRQLERIEKEAANPDAREKAGEALDKGTSKNRSNGSPSSGSEENGTPAKAPKKGNGGAANNAPNDSSSPGGGSSRRSDNGKRGESGRAVESHGQPAKPRDPRAAQLQLEDFAKKVNKDILKDAGVSEEAWKKYLESKRKQVAPREKPRPETPAHPQQATPLPSMGGRTIQPSSSGPDDLHGPDRGQPPPGYRDSFREFTRQMTKGK
jgi:hypothetical protein